MGPSLAPGTAEQLVNILVDRMCLHIGFHICEVGTALVSDSFLPPRDDLRENEVMSGRALRASEAA